MSNEYSLDLAYVHDVGYGDFAKEAGPSLLKLLTPISGNSRIVDLGCGSGIWARILADSRYEVVGVDISPAMIQIAKQRVPEATFYVQSFVDFVLPECSAVTALGEVFNYLFDPVNSQEKLEQIFRAVHRALLSGGLFIFDIAEPNRSSGLKQAFREGPDWTCLVEYHHDQPRRLLSRRIVTFRNVDGNYRRHEETHHQLLYPRTEIAALLREIGFHVEIVETYGDQPFPHGVAGFVARKV